MSILTVIIVIVLVGLALWFINRYVPMDPVIKNILQGVIVLFLILWLLQAFGVLGSLGSVRIR